MAGIRIVPMALRSTKSGGGVQASGGGADELPDPPAGFAYLVNGDGAFLINADGKYIVAHLGD
jgi:hypothetical protein